MLRIGIIGCGLIGKKRLAGLTGARLTVACDLVASRAEELARGIDDCLVLSDPQAAISSDKADAFIIATQNADLAPLALQAVSRGKHCLLEKPGAMNTRQLEEVEGAAKTSGALVRIGYNHRYHPAFRKAQELFHNGALGPLMFLRARYGHGGRVGYEREWRADPKRSGGGELIDQGVHLIDLASWFLGEFASVDGHTATYFWDMPVDDNAFLSLQTASGQTAWLHASCTEWKNTFSFELYGRNAKLHIEGLGGSYGTERLTHYAMLPEMGPPETTVYEYPRGDVSWKLELTEFIEDIRLKRTPVPGLLEGKRVLAVVDTIYKKVKSATTRG